jgi:hypothetical protein
MKDLIASALNAPFRSFEEATQHLEDTAKRGGVRHLSYWYLNVEGEAADDLIWISTYDPAYMSRYMANYTPFGDPALSDLMEQDCIIGSAMTILAMVSIPWPTALASPTMGSHSHFARAESAGSYFRLTSIATTMHGLPHAIS